MIDCKLVLVNDPLVVRVLDIKVDPDNVTLFVGVLEPLELAELVRIDVLVLLDVNEPVELGLSVDVRLLVDEAVCVFEFIIVIVDVDEGDTDFVDLIDILVVEEPDAVFDAVVVDELVNDCKMLCDLSGDLLSDGDAVELLDILVDNELVPLAEGVFDKGGDRVMVGELVDVFVVVIEPVVVFVVVIDFVNWAELVCDFDEAIVIVRYEEDELVFDGSAETVTGFVSKAVCVNCIVLVASLDIADDCVRPGVRDAVFVDVALSVGTTKISRSIRLWLSCMKGVKDTFAVQSDVDVDAVVVRKPIVNNRRCHRILSTFVNLFIYTGFTSFNAVQLIGNAFSRRLLTT